MTEGDEIMAPKGPFRASDMGAANDGSIGILDGDGNLLLRVHMRNPPKRGAWNAKDPQRDADVAFVVAALNAAYEITP
jgi:hypothetical protein